MGCDCYVSMLDPETRFGLRRGAHNLRCPEYRESLDPVDRWADYDFRLATEGPTLDGGPIDDTETIRRYEEQVAP